MLVVLVDQNPTTLDNSLVLSDDLPNTTALDVLDLEGLCDVLLRVAVGHMRSLYMSMSSRIHVLHLDILRIEDRLGRNLDRRLNGSW